MRAAFIVLLAMALAGCAQPSTPAMAPGSDDASMTEVHPSCLEGIIVDEELMPVSGAKVELLPGAWTETTDAAGRFVLCGLPAGRYVLTATRDAYHPYGATIDMPSEPLDIVLRARPVPQPHIVVVPKVIHYTLGLSSLDSTAARNALPLPSCSPCTWSLTLDTLPDHLVWEATWQRNPTPPSASEDRMYHVLRAGADFAQGEDIGVGDEAQPYSFRYPKSQMLETSRLRDAKAAPALTGSMFCSGNLAWPCIDQRINIHLSLFYDYAMVPADYSAMPKD